MFSQQIAKVLARGDRGAVLVEYAALFVLVVIVAIAALSAFGVTVLELYSDSADQYSGAVQRTAG